MKFCVIGIGSFGYHVATKLVENGMDVLAIDQSEEKINDIRDHVTHAICATIDDEQSLRNVGMEEIDTVIVALGKSFAQSMLITALLKKRLNIKWVIARSNSEIQKEIHELIGADQVILPEQAMGIKLADTLSSPFIDLLSVGKNFSISQIIAPSSFVGKMIGDLNFYQNYHVRCIGIKKDNEIVITSPEHTVQENDTLIFAGNDEALKDLTKVK